MSLVRITEPAEVPLSLSEVKAIARLEGLDATDDPVIAGYIRAATDWVEQQLGRALITQVWTYTVNGFPCGYHPQLRIPLGPVQSIDEVVYVDADGLPQVLDPARYTLAFEHIWPAYSTTWPGSRPQPDAVVVTFTVGFGPDWNSIPEPIRYGIATLVAGYYDGCSNEDAVVNMLSPWKAWTF
jgi:uncharacterized phiE125 gp8 family phage protein